MKLYKPISKKIKIKINANYRKSVTQYMDHHMILMYLTAYCHSS